MEFWHEFDDVFNPSPGFMHIPPEVRASYIYESRLLPLWVISHSDPNYPKNFIQAISESSDLINAIKLLNDYQLRIMDGHFKGDIKLQQRSFEWFGQGILFDNGVDEKTGEPRRPIGRKVHMMDELAVYGYSRWHAFIRATVFLGQEKDTWLHIDRLVGLAWSIHTRLQPKQDNPNNPERQDVVDELRPPWLSKGFDELDKAFDTDELRRILRL